MRFERRGFVMRFRTGAAFLGFRRRAAVAACAIILGFAVARRALCGFCVVAFRAGIQSRGRTIC
ncbi:hypothetical protein D3C86_1308960 [compost metagenome]